MAKAQARKLKVFQAQFGFYDSVVAAPSQVAALKAWGTHQNLFKDGQARLTTDDAAVKAALDHPEIPLRRAVGSTNSFELNPQELPRVPDPLTRTPDPAATPAPGRKAPLATPPADRTQLDAAEADLRRLDEARKAEEKTLQGLRDELDAKIADAQSAYVASRKSVTAKLVNARKAYRAKGGRE